MSQAKDLRVYPLKREDANKIIRRFHYSGKTVNNSQLHLGVFLNGRCEGAMQFGPSLDKRKLQALVRDTPWNGFIELNRMAFSDALPRNSESRALGVALRTIRRHYPHIQWIVSFADATQCGDGTIYRAAGFVLTQIKKNSTLWAIGGETFSSVALTDHTSSGQKAKAREILANVTVTKGKHAAKQNGRSSMKDYRAAGFEPLPGYQMRYVYFLDPTARARLTVPVLPFSEIAKTGAGMYLGKPISRRKHATVGVHPTSEGEAPIPALQTNAA